MKKNRVFILTSLLLTMVIPCFALTTPIDSADVPAPVNLDKPQKYPVVTLQPKNHQVTPKNTDLPPHYNH